MNCVSLFEIEIQNWDVTWFKMEGGFYKKKKKKKKKGGNRWKRKKKSKRKAAATGGFLGDKKKGRKQKGGLGRVAGRGDRESRESSRLWRKTKGGLRWGKTKRPREIAARKQSKRKMKRGVWRRSKRNIKQGGGGWVLTAEGKQKEI